MISARPFVLAVLSALIVAGAGCSKPTATTRAPSASPAQTLAPAALAPAAAVPTGDSAAAEATAPATATPEPNLLSAQSGTILRSYPSSDADPDGSVSGMSAPDNDAGPWVFVYELPGVSTLSRVTAKVAPKTDSGQGSKVTFATSTTSATSGFSDVATIGAAATGDEQAAPVSVRARWVRVTIARTGSQAPYESLGAFGTSAPPAAIPVAGTYVQYAKAYDAGGFVTAPNDQDPWYLQVVTLPDGGINGEQCFNGHLGETYPGSLSGRTWTWKRSDAGGTYIANDEGTLLVGTGGTPTYWVRTSQRPKYCVPAVTGSGPGNVVMLESTSWYSTYPGDEQWTKDVPALRFSRIGAGLLDQALLDGASTVWLNGLCNTDDLIAPAQGQALAQWIAAGHKLLITDSDMCKKTHYAFLPYAFTSDNPGAQGAKGDRLIQVEDDALGTSDTTDKAHFFDPRPWTIDSNQLGDANTVTTHDDHWCGHFFGTNVNHINGFMQMYALYGKGLIIFDGFDRDDGDEPPYQRVRRLELALPVPPDLPCTQKASLAFVIEPDRDAKFAAGKAATLPFSMELLANQGWKGHVNVTTSGDFRGTVTPSSFDVNGTTQALKIAVAVPASAKPGTYAVIVNGDAGNGQTAQATIHLHADVSLAKQLKTQRRIRIYGIHFDVDRATIKPQSEPVIAQIAQLMKQNPAWRFRVEGHTDSDGGMQHNQVLSQHRAESVVNDLVKRYHIARGRLVPAGFGYSKPVAPNTTAAGKALNRRVELYLLNA